MTTPLADVPTLPQPVAPVARVREAIGAVEAALARLEELRTTRRPVAHAAAVPHITAGCKAVTPERAAELEAENARLRAEVARLRRGRRLIGATIAVVFVATAIASALCTPASGAASAAELERVTSWRRTWDRDPSGDLLENAERARRGGRVEAVFEVHALVALERAEIRCTARDGLHDVVARGGAHVPALAAGERRRATVAVELLGADPDRLSCELLVSRAR